MIIPKWAKRYLSEAMYSEVSEAVAKIELQTSAELVPMVVRRSSSVGHVRLIVFLLSLMVFETLHLVNYFNVFEVASAWVWVIHVVVSVLLAFFGAKCPVLQRVFTAKDDQAAQVVARARLEFYESKIKQTAGATGVLFFVSLMERQAVVLADKTISDRLPKETWSEVVRIIIEGVRQNSLGKGLLDGLYTAERLLVPLFPVQPNDINELSNNLIIKE